MQSKHVTGVTETNNRVTDEGEEQRKVQENNKRWQPVYRLQELAIQCCAHAAAITESVLVSTQKVQIGRFS